MVERDAERKGQKGRSMDITKSRCHVRNPKGHIRTSVVIEMKPRDNGTAFDIDGFAKELELLREEHLATQPKKRRHRK